MGRYLGRCQDPECNRAVFTDSPGYDEYTGYDELYCSRCRSRSFSRSHVPESPIEERFFRAWHEIFPDIEAIPQYSVLSYYLDLGLPQLMIGIELDGAAWHSSELAVFQDKMRQEHIEATGWTVLRFTGSAVNTSPETCVREAGRQIAAVLIRRWTSNK